MTPGTTDSILRGHVEHARRTLDQLLANVSANSLVGDKAVLPLAEAMAELTTVTEELGVADEELREQNEELMLAREEAQRLALRYRELFDGAPGAYLVTTREGVVTEA